MNLHFKYSLPDYDHVLTISNYSVYNLEIIVTMGGQLRLYGHQSHIAVQSECTLWICSEISCNYCRLLIFSRCITRWVAGIEI